MLSKKYAEQVNFFGLYKSAPMPETLPSYLRTDPYHCHNWTFHPVKAKDPDTGILCVSMVDTYYGDFAIEVTDENFHRFEFLFDTREYRDAGPYVPDDYDPKDYIRAAVGSGGISNAHYFIRKDAKRSREAMIRKCSRELSDLYRSLDLQETRLKQLTADSQSGNWGYVYTPFGAEESVVKSGFASECLAYLGALKDGCGYDTFSIKRFDKETANGN